MKCRQVHKSKRKASGDFVLTPTTSRELGLRVPPSPEKTRDNKLVGTLVMSAMLLSPLVCGLLLPVPLLPRALCTASRARTLAMAYDEPTNYVDQNLQPPSLEEQMKA